MDDEKKIFSKNLLRILSEHRKTQAEVADEIGVSRAAMNMWCNGVTIPRMPKIQILAKYFGCTVGDLVNPPEKSDTSEADDLLKRLFDKTLVKTDMSNHDFVLNMNELSKGMSIDTQKAIIGFTKYLVSQEENSDDDKKDDE